MCRHWSEPIAAAQQASEAVYDRWARAPLAACFAGFLLVASIGGALATAPAKDAGVASRLVAAQQAPETPAGSTMAIGIMLMTRYAVVLEVAGVLLLLAMVGAIAIARKKFERGTSNWATSLGESGRKAEPF